MPMIVYGAMLEFAYLIVGFCFGIQVAMLASITFDAYRETRGLWIRVKRWQKRRKRRLEA
jgi:hypothetical protein